MQKYFYYLDPGHAWVEVKEQELVKLGIANKISGYSYQNGPNVYLEEDCDYPIFLNRKRELGEEFELVEVLQIEDSPIRGYKHYEWLK